MFFTPLLQGGALLNNNSAAIPKIDAVSSNVIVGVGAVGSASWTHTPVGNPSAVVVFTYNTDYATTGVTYGGKKLNLVAICSASNSTFAGSNGYCYVSNTALPTGPQTVAVTFAAGTSGSIGTAITLTDTPSTNPIRSFSISPTPNPNAGGLGEIYLDIPRSDLGICAAGFRNLSNASLSPTDGSIVDFTTTAGRTATFVHKSGPHKKFNFSTGSTSGYSMLALSVQPASYTPIIPQVDQISSFTVSPANTTTHSWTHTPINKPSAVVVYTHNQDFATTNVSYGGIALNLITSKSNNNTNSQTGLCWASNTALPTGPQEITVTASNSYAGGGKGAVAYTLFNSSVTNPVRSFASNTSPVTVNAGTVYLDVPAGDLGICGVGFINAAGANINPTDEKIKDIQISPGSVYSSYTHAAGPQKSFNFTRTAGTFGYAMIAVSIQPAESVLATRLANTGNYFVNGYFDEVSKKISSVDSSSIVYSSEFDETSFGKLVFLESQSTTSASMNVTYEGGETVFVGLFNRNTGNTGNFVTDGTNTYNFVNSGGLNFQSFLYKADNVARGTFTISRGFGSISLFKYRGISPGPAQANTGGQVTNGGASTTTLASLTPTSQPAVYIAFIGQQNQQTLTPTGSTGFITRRGQPILSNGVLIEKEVTSLSPIAAVINSAPYEFQDYVAGIFSLAPTTFARRIANTGNTYITGSFDEYTKIS